MTSFLTIPHDQNATNSGNINHSLSERESIFREVQFTIPMMIFLSNEKLLKFIFLKNLSIYTYLNIRAK